MTTVASRPPAAPEPEEPAGRRGRRSHTVLYTALAFAVVVVALVGILATRKPAADRPVYSALVGKAAPAVSGTTIDGKQFDLSQLQGKWVLVNFFATWCGPCLKEHPELQAWSREHTTAGDGQVVGVVYGDDVSAVKRFFGRNGGDWPVVVDNGKDPIATNYGVTAPPESYLVAPNGQVVTKLVGGVRARDIDALMTRLEQESGSNMPTSSAPTRP